MQCSLNVLLVVFSGGLLTVGEPAPLLVFVYNVFVRCSPVPLFDLAPVAAKLGYLGSHMSTSIDFHTPGVQFANISLGTN